MYVQPPIATEIESLCRILQVPPEELQHAVLEMLVVGSNGVLNAYKAFTIPPRKLFLITNLQLQSHPRDASGQDLRAQTKPYSFFNSFSFTFLVEDVNRMTPTVLSSIGNVWVVLPSGLVTVQLNFSGITEPLSFVLYVAAHGYLVPTETQGLLETMKTMFF